MTSRIVVGVDGSAHSNEGLRWALAHAERLGDTEVVAVFAWGLPLIEFPGAFDKDEIEAGAKRFLQETIQHVAPEPPVPLKLVVAHGDPATSLIEASQEASLLVVGTRGRNPFRGLLLGSVAQGCAADSACPVVIVKLRQGTERDGAATGALEAVLTDDR
jgi:nucleotide-binding universal stress UspA family protein